MAADGPSEEESTVNGLLEACSAYVRFDASNPNAATTVMANANKIVLVFMTFSPLGS
jgi:hypothetical protein